jgi:hypothetical protein
MVDFMPGRIGLRLVEEPLHPSGPRLHSDRRPGSHFRLESVRDARAGLPSFGPHRLELNLGGQATWFVLYGMGGPNEISGQADGVDVTISFHQRHLSQAKRECFGRSNVSDLELKMARDNHEEIFSLDAGLQEFALEVEQGKRIKRSHDAFWFETTGSFTARLKAARDGGPDSIHITF